MGCLDQDHGLHIIQMKEIQPKFPLINPVPLPPKVSSKSKQHSISPPAVQPAPKPLTPPNCGNPHLQKHIEALYLDPVIISVKAISSLEHRGSSLETI
jgi:hypothetical protein